MTALTGGHFLRLSADQLAHGGAIGSLGLVGVDVHSGSTAHIDADNYIVEDQLAAFAAAGAPDVPASARDTDPSIAVVAVRADDVGKSSGRKNFPLLRPGYRDTDVNTCQ